jgi:hypothetical protein
VALVSTTVSSRSNRSFRRRGELEVPPPRGALHPADGRRAAAHRTQAPVEPIGDAVEPAHDAAQLLQQLPPPLALLDLGQTIGDPLHHLAHRAKGAQRGVELEAESFVPDGVGRKLVAQPELAGLVGLEPVGEALEQGVGGPARVGDRRKETLAEEVETGATEQVGPAG